MSINNLNTQSKRDWQWVLKAWLNYMLSLWEIHLKCNDMLKVKRMKNML